MRILDANDHGIAEAVTSLRKGEVIAYPTETVYGLGVDPMSDSALDRLFAVKERDRNASVLLIIGTMRQLDALVKDIDPVARILLERFWPGPLSLLFSPLETAPPQLAGPDGRICVRWTSSLIAQKLCLNFGGAIVSTSANRSGEAPASDLNALNLDGISVALDGGALTTENPSTVYDPRARKVLRKGAVGFEDIERALAEAGV